MKLIIFVVFCGVFISNVASLSPYRSYGYQIPDQRLGQPKSTTGLIPKRLLNDIFNVIRFITNRLIYLLNGLVLINTSLPSRILSRFLARPFTFVYMAFTFPFKFLFIPLRGIVTIICKIIRPIRSLLFNFLNVIKPASAVFYPTLSSRLEY